MIAIRLARPSDQDALGRCGAALMRQHHAADTRRFIDVAHPEAGYGRYLVSQIAEGDSLVMVAHDGDDVFGYVYAGIESTDWMNLRGPAGVVHDLFVDPAARRQGAGRLLMRAAIAWIRERGRTQVVLMTKTQNEHAQQLFAALGFRPTMVEMTLDVTMEDPRS